VTTEIVHLTFANWRKSTVISPIGESPPYFRQYTPGLSPLANVLLANIPSSDLSCFLYFKILYFIQVFTDQIILLVQLSYQDIFSYALE
jgi:hypothetical protein